jgi:hypothetical protein
MAITAAQNTAITARSAGASVTIRDPLPGLPGASNTTISILPRRTVTLKRDVLTTLLTPISPGRITASVRGYRSPRSVMPPHVPNGRRLTVVPRGAFTVRRPERGERAPAVPHERDAERAGVFPEHREVPDRKIDPPACRPGDGDRRRAGRRDEIEGLFQIRVVLARDPDHAHAHGIFRLVSGSIESRSPMMTSGLTPERSAALAPPSAATISVRFSGEPAEERGRRGLPVTEEKHARRGFLSRMFSGKFSRTISPMISRESSRRFFRRFSRKFSPRFSRRFS